MDLLGQRFGRWEVIDKSDKSGYWKCRCDCGTIREVNQNSLRRGLSKSCGCLQTNITNVVGNRFGKLIVTSQEHNKCQCVCDCGETITVTVRELVRGRKKSCGCLKHVNENLVGQRFTKLVAIAKMYKHGDVGYLCKCDCGNETWFRAYELRRGIVKSCGCLKHDISNDLTGRRFGKLIVVGNPKRDKESHNVIWECRCDCGNTAFIPANQLLKGNNKSCGCLSTGQSGSLIELEIKDYIEQISHKSFSRDRSVLDGKEIDIYNDELKVGIEYNGSIYHASSGSVFYDKPVRYHYNKFLLAKTKGVHLITIFDVDWAENSERIKMYLKSIFDVDKLVIFGRKCEVKNVSLVEAEDFCTKYHLQGWNHLGKINIGLYYNDTLVSLMSFGKQRLKGDIEGYFDIHRYCVKEGISVVGGADKLLKYFERNYFPKLIRSYSDNNYFTGGVYERLGFKISKKYCPDYYWYWHNTKVKRELCQPKKLKKLYPDVYDSIVEGGKETGVMLSLGACRIYTCGNTCWEKTY